MFKVSAYIVFGIVLAFLFALFFSGLESLSSLKTLPPEAIDLEYQDKLDRSYDEEIDAREKNDTERVERVKRERLKLCDEIQVLTRSRRDNPPFWMQLFD